MPKFELAGIWGGIGVGLGVGILLLIKLMRILQKNSKSPDLSNHAYT